MPVKLVHESIELARPLAAQLAHPLAKRGQHQVLAPKSEGRRHGVRLARMDDTERSFDELANRIGGLRSVEGLRDGTASTHRGHQPEDGRSVDPALVPGPHEQIRSD